MKFHWNNPLIWIGIAGLVLVLIAIAWNYKAIPENTISSQSETRAPAPEVVAVTPDPQAAVHSDSQDEQATFDIIRISPEGLGVFAGQGPKNSEIIIKSNGKEIGRVRVDDRGEWVWVAEEALASGSHTLSLEILQDSSLQSTSTVAVVVVPDLGTAEEEKTSFALVVPKAEDEGIVATTLLQTPNFKAGVADDENALGVDTIDYNDKGEVIISGRATAGSTVRLYLDNKKMGETQVPLGEKKWSFQPKGELAEGRYRLKVDQVLPDGTIAKKIELPFQHARYIARDDETFGEQRIVVQPGNSLWRIARRTLGKGTHYVIIFEANRNQIEDQDLIYPGQVFIIPPSHHEEQVSE